MVRWGIGIILIGVLVMLLVSGTAGGALVDVGKYVVGIGLFIWVIWLIFGAFGGRGGAYGPPVP